MRLTQVLPMALVLAMTLALTPTLYGDAELLTDQSGRDPHISVWGEYGNARAETALRLMVDQHANGSIDDFEVELDGRKALASAWRATPAKPSRLYSIGLPLRRETTARPYTPYPRRTNRPSSTSERSTRST